MTDSADLPLIHVVDDEAGDDLHCGRQIRVVAARVHHDVVSAPRE